MQIFQFLAVPLGYVLRWLYLFLNNYGWAIILFTFLVRVVMFPLALKQQKSTARNAAFQPMIKEIQAKWANDRNRQQQELQKFQQENNMKMSAGCLPAIINMIVLFGIIAVIQAPLTYIVQLPAEDVSTGIAIVEKIRPELKIRENAYTSESVLIGEIKAEPQLFLDGVTVTAEDGTTRVEKLSQETIDKVTDFKFQFLGLDLSMAPTTSNWVTLIMPIISVLASLGSQLLIMFTSGQQQSKMQALLMTVVFTAMFGFFAFRVPSGFSVYYTASSLVQTIQQLIVRQIHNPKKIAAEIQQEIEERKKAKKNKKKVVIKDEDGQVITKDMSEAELNKLRLEQARALDAKRYAEDEEMSAKAREAAEKARKLDEEKYGSGRSGKKKALPEKSQADEAANESDAEKADDIDDAPDVTDMTGDAPPAEEDAPEKPAAEKPAETKTSKPGRRRRASLNKDGQEKSFAQREMENEKKPEDEAPTPVKEDEPDA